MKFSALFLLAMACLTASAQNGTGIHVYGGSTSVCPNALYTYQMQIVGSNICYIEVRSTGGHRFVCGSGDSGSHPTSDFGYFQSFTPYPQGQVFSICMHWVSSGTKTLCFDAYNCNGSLASSFCLNIGNNSPSPMVQGNTYVCNGQYAYFTAGTSGLSNYVWSVVPDASETIYPSGGGVVVNIGNLQYNSWHMVSVSAVDCWGTTKYASKSFWTTQCAGNPGPEAGSRDDQAAESDRLGSEILVYPNPVNQGELLMVDMEKTTSAIKEYRLYGLDGRLLQYKTAPAIFTTLEMPAQPGIYMLVLLDENNQLHRHKITVM